jgi:hypothetical protein
MADATTEAAMATMVGKRKTKKVHADGTVSWETIADAGEVDRDEEDENVGDLSLPQTGGGTNVVQKFNLAEPLTSEKLASAQHLFKRMANGKGT